MTHQTCKETFWCQEYDLQSPLQPALFQLQSSFWPPLLPAGPHLGMQPQQQELVLLRFSWLRPFYPAVPPLSIQALDSPVNWNPSPGNKSLVLCCSLSDLNKFFLHVPIMWQKTREVFQRWTISLFYCSYGEICQQLYKTWAQPSSEKQMNKKYNRHCCWK